MNSPKTFRRQSLSRPLFAAVLVIITELYVPLAPAKGCPVDTDSKLPILSRVNQVRKLPRDRAALGYRVRLRGLVTYYDPEWFILFVQDSTGGIYVYPKGIALSLRPGQQVEIEGFTAFGNTAPIVVKPRIRVLGHASPPDPKRVSINHLITGSEDSQWVETDAVVRSVTEIWGRYLQLDLASGGGRLKALISSVQGVDPARFVDAKVRVRGVCGTEFDEKQEPLGFLLYVPDLRLVNVLEQPPPDPFGVQAYSIAGLAQLPANPTFTRRVRVQGVVTLQRPGRLLSIRMETGGLLVETQQTTSVRPGDRVEIVGFPEGAGRRPLLQDAIFRRVGTSAPPLPVKLTTKELLGGYHHAELVQIEARLLDRKLTSAEQVLVLQAGDLILNAQLEDSKAMQKLASLREGSVLRISGVYLSERGQRRESFSLTMLLRSPDDVVVLKVPSWWTLRHALWVLGCLVVVSLFALLWVAGLRRKVREQTAFIGEQLRLEEALKKRYLAVFENVNDVIFVHDLEGRITACNRAGAALTGYSRGEILRMKVSDLMSAGYVELTREMTTGKQPGISKSTFEVEIIAKDGRRVPVEVGTRLMKREGEVTGVLGVARDITERKRAEEALRDSEKRFRLLFERAPLSYQSLDENGCFIDVNPAWLAFFGYGREEVVGRWFGDLMTPESAEAVKKNFPRFKAAGEIYGLEYEMVRKDGSHFIASVSGKIGCDEQGRFAQTHCILADITERKRAEEALRESEERFRSLVENATVGIYRTTPEGRILMANSALVRMLGYESFQALATRDLAKEGFEPTYPRSAFRERVGREGEVTGLEAAWKRRDGSVIHVRESARAGRASDGRVLYYDGIVEDVTERHRAEEELKKRASLLRDTGEMAKVGGWELDLSTQEVSWTEEVCRIHGVEPGYKPKLEEALNFYAPESRPALEEVLKKAAETGEPYDLESLFIPSGSKDKIWVRSLGRAVYSGGKIVKLAGTFQDINKYKRAEETLRESEEKHRTLFETMAQGVVYQNTEGHIISANPAAERLLGLTLAQMLGRTSMDPKWKAIHEDGSDFPGDTHPAMIALKTGKEVSHVVMGVFRPGANEYVWIDIHAAPQFRPDETKPYQVYTTFDDITERKRAEEELRESEQNYRELAESISDVFFAMDKDLRYTYWNKASEKLTGISAKHALGKSPYELFPEMIGTRAQSLYLDAMRTGQPHTFVNQYQLKGEDVVFELNAHPSHRGLSVIARDITERRRAEESMRQLSGRLLRLQDEERRRIARELHDTTAQSLVALAINLSVVKNSAPDLNPRACACLSQSLELAEQCSREIRTLSYLLHPPLLDEIGLAPALRWYTEGFAQRSEIQVQVDVPSDLGELPADVELTFYRVVQEGLTNIHLHSGSKTARISVERQRDQIILTVADEGHGFSPAVSGIAGRKGARLGVGISGMRERIRQLGGRLHVRSTGQGTTLTAILPLGQVSNGQTTHPIGG